jgi:hypothetical protein
MMTIVQSDSPCLSTEVGLDIYIYIYYYYFMLYVLLDTPGSVIVPCCYVL